MQLTILETISQSSEDSTSTAAEKKRQPNDGVKIYKWTQKEYYRMADLGFFDGKRVELIEGEIIEMAPMKTAHSTALDLAAQILAKIFTEQFIVRTQMPISFSKTSEPEPDIMIVQGGIRDFSNSHPTTAELIVEVSDSTLRYDRTVKAALYARNNIGEYWILNLKDSVLEVHRQPKKDKNLGFIYGEKVIYTDGEEVSPLNRPEIKIKIADILP